MRLRLPKSINCCKQLVDKWSIFSQIRRIRAKLTPDLGNTAFGQTGVSECTTNCSLTAIQKIAFDDGTSYSLTYDSGTSSGHYGVLTGITVRTGGTISYGYTTFTDGLGNHTRWLSSKTFGTNAWSFTPQSQGQTSQQVTVSVPSGDSIIYSFSLNNGAWETGATYVDATRGTLLYLTNTWDTSISCPHNGGCSGAAYVRKLTSKTQFPSGLAKTTTYLYTSTTTGQVSEIDESDYSTATPPILRKTLFTYAPLDKTILLLNLLR
jgi:hypothetical protein